MIASLPTRLERAEREIADLTRLAKQLDGLVRFSSHDPLRDSGQKSEHKERKYQFS
jgi:hypothetical protein